MRALRRFAHGHLAVFLMAALFLVSCTTPEPPAPPPRQLTTPLRGITLESLDDLSRSLDLMAASPAPLTVRVVMDTAMQPEEYRDAVARIHDRAQVMVQVVDSEQLTELSTTEVADRTRAALRDLGEWVDVWEIGNEPNGEWAGSSPKEINAKVAAAHDVVAQAGRPTALTLNYWSSPDCYEYAWEDTMRFAHTVTRHPD